MGRMFWGKSSFVALTCLRQASVGECSTKKAERRTEDWNVFAHFFAEFLIFD